jgi:putative salt-induced outer membrane protein YdiY
MRSARALRIRMLVGVMTCAGEASAQVNIESLRTDLRKTPATASIEGSFTGRTGNTESVVFGAGGLGAARSGRHGMFGSTQADYARFNGVTQVSKSFIHVRYHYELLDWLYPEVFAQQQQDKFQRLKLRELVGAGPRFILDDEDAFRLAIGTSYMLEYERISVSPGAPDDPTTFSHRSSTYVTTTWQADARVRFAGTVYFQPRFDQPDDFRILMEGALVTEIVKRLSVKVLVTVRYDSAPPTAVKTTDAEVKNAFVLQF